MATERDPRRRLVEAALAYPGAFEDFPWGERVAKVNRRIFAFFGADDRETSGMAIKLPDSYDFALSFRSATPSGYGLGRAGWVRIDFDRPECPEIDLRFNWLDELPGCCAKTAARRVGRTRGQRSINDQDAACTVTSSCRSLE